MNILIIDDSKTVRKSLSVALKNSNHKIYEAENGMEGFAKSFLLKPDLIFVDVMMPRLDGFQVCQALKNKNWANNSFICMLTGKDNLLDRAKIKNYKANYLIIKPFITKDLLLLINEVENKTFNRKIIL